MKVIFRGILTYSVAIALVSVFFPGISYGNTLSSLLIAAIALGIVNTFIKPILTLILLPITVITLGLVGLFLNTIVLFLATLLVPSFNIIPFDLTLTTGVIHIPLFWSYVIASVAINLVVSILRALVNPD